MSLLYSFLSTALGLLLLPLVVVLASRSKHRGRIGKRLGWGLTSQLAVIHSSATTFWIHALSVGEVTSALPLVRGLRQNFPAARIVVSSTTRSGGEVARALLSPFVDALIAAPLDFGPVVPFFINVIKPDIFLLVETDFWPHWLHCLAQKNIPAILVNGRISEQSFARYRRYAFFFRPMFRSFTLLSMQTSADASHMADLGIPLEKIVTLGNLKFDLYQPSDAPDLRVATPQMKLSYGFETDHPLWICGSTHRGEEETIFQTYRLLQKSLAHIQLLLAPRNIERTTEIMDIARRHNVVCRRWSTEREHKGPVLLLDTIGELAKCYPMADAAFIGGSLVAEGGHNPIEAAAAAVPVVFGPHMEDFAEIAEALIQCGGACQIESRDTLLTTIQQLLIDKELHQATADAALACVRNNRGVVPRHLEAIKSLLALKSADA